MKKSYVKKLMLLGISTRTNNANEKNEETQKIPSLWEKYDVDGMYSKTFNKLSNTSFYGVYSNYESDVNGDYDVTVAVEVTKTKDDPMIIENKKYLLFTKEGELPDICTELWDEVWEFFENNSEYERAYAVDFEKYSKENLIEIYISIK